MKKILFSRSHKKRYSDTVVRMGKNNLGFSLVELVIVIAIMAILAAIAIPVFGVFIEKAKMSNDKSLINDIVYAIELGNKAGVFMDVGATSIGSTKIPIGFIVVTPTEGCKVIVSNSEMVITQDEPCKIETATIVTGYNTDTYENSGTVIQALSMIFQLESKYIVYKDIQTTQIQYCSTHTTLPTKTVHTGVSQETKKVIWETYTFYKSSGTQAYTFMEDCNGIYALATDHQSGEIRTTISMNYNEAIPTIQATEGNPIYDCLADVLGPDLASLKLTSENWDAIGEQSFSTFYSSADKLFTQIETLGSTLVSAAKTDGAVATLGLKQKYSSTDELLSVMTNSFATAFPNPADWDAIWASVPNQTCEGYGFGLDAYGRETYCAARAGYNAGFASYLTSVNYAKADVVRNYYTQSLLGVNLPGTICKDAFVQGVKTNPDGTNNYNDNYLYQQLGKDAAAFEEVKQHYENYVASSIHAENGKAFITTLISMNETSSSANKTGDYMGYYENYFKGIGSLYEEASKLAGTNGVLITIYVEDGVASCEFSPASADPRNK